MNPLMEWLFPDPEPVQPTLDVPAGWCLLPPAWIAAACEPEAGA